MRSLSSLCLGLFLFASSSSVSATRILDGVDAVRSQADLAMAKVGAGDVEGAVRDLGKSWPLPPAELENLIEQTKLQAPAMERRFGSIIGHEFIAEHTVGSSFVRRIYLQRFDRHAMRWVITYYRSGEGWVVNSVVFDDNLQTLFSVES